MVLETTVIKICVPTVSSQAISTRANLWLVLQSSIVLSTFLKLYLADTSRLLGKYQGGYTHSGMGIISYHFKLQKQEYECSVSNGQDGLQELT